MANTNSDALIKSWSEQSKTSSGFAMLANSNPAIKAKTLEIYKNDTGKDINPDNELAVGAAALAVWKKYGSESINTSIILGSAGITDAENASANSRSNTGTEVIPQNLSTPFDRRLDRLRHSIRDDSTENFVTFVPFSSDFAELSTTSYMISKRTLDDLPDDIGAANANGQKTTKADALKKAQADYDLMAKDDFYKGVPSLQNYYSLTRLYGAQGGKYLVNEKNKRRWYEVDTNPDNLYNYASTPTTSSLISWGRGDPYGRTPYQFTDFVFSKYWNKIANNRLITLRRYAAPMLDNLKFPGMVSPTSKDSDKGKEALAFPPMATAVTYFGGDTGNSLSSLLKFTTGMPWKDIQAAVWEVQTDNVPDNTSGIGSIFGSVAKLGELLNVAGGNYDRDLVNSGGTLPPDPYKDGPYENRIMGPVNRIDKVMKREPGLTFEWSGLNIVFEYVARPVGGINPKAVLLDIMSNFFVMGSASAVFFGGAHRFMAAPAKYPFIGGGKGIEQWYKGEPLAWANSAIDQFATGTSSPTSLGNAFFATFSSFFSKLGEGFSGLFPAINGLMAEGSPLGNLTKNYMAQKTVGQVPFLQGMKAILTGEPVGEWHVTIGNPLNPIAMIGNLICENVQVEFNEELGPDDFPTEMKFTVKLNHAMARDRDAIESVFNRGMGRIYMLPDSMSGSADFQTSVDKSTQQKGVNVGYAPNRRLALLYQPGLDSGNISKKELQSVPDPLGGEISVWNRAAFGSGISENSSQQFISSENELFQAAYRTSDWIAQKSI